MDTQLKKVTKFFAFFRVPHDGWEREAFAINPLGCTETVPELYVVPVPDR